MFAILWMSQIVSQSRNIEIVNMQMNTDAITRHGVSSVSVIIATSDTNIVSAMLYIAFLRTVLISLLLI